jgi:hypothetical protein
MGSKKEAARKNMRLKNCGHGVFFARSVAIRRASDTWH